MRWEVDERWLYEWWNDYTTIEYQIVIDKKAGVIESKSKMLQWYQRCFSHKNTDFKTFTSEVCRLIRYEEKLEKIGRKSYTLFVKSYLLFKLPWLFEEIKENVHIDLSYKIIKTDLKELMSL